MKKETKVIKYTSIKPTFLTLPKGLETPKGDHNLLFKFIKGEKFGFLELTFDLPMTKKDQELVDFIENHKKFGKIIKRQPSKAEIEKMEREKEQEKLAQGYVKSKMIEAISTEMKVDTLRAMATELGVSTKAKNKQTLSKEKLVEKIEERLIKVKEKMEKE